MVYRDDAGKKHIIFILNIVRVKGKKKKVGKGGEGGTVSSKSNRPMQCKMSDP